MEEIQLPKIITLNVGGHLFTTSLDTLLQVPNTMFSGMFSGRFPINTSKDGSFFIDRDGTHFRWILNFLRDNSSIENLHDTTILKELLLEARYYCILPLIKEIEQMQARRVYYICNGEANADAIANILSMPNFQVKVLHKKNIIGKTKLDCDAVVISIHDIFDCDAALLPFIDSGGTVVLCAATKQVQSYRTEYFQFYAGSGYSPKSNVPVLETVHFTKHPILEGVKPFSANLPFYSMIGSLNTNQYSKLIAVAGGREIIGVSNGLIGIVVSINIPIEVALSEENMRKLLRNSLSLTNATKWRA